MSDALTEQFLHAAMNEIAQYLSVTDRLATAYALVCNPCHAAELEKLSRHPDLSWLPFILIWPHAWCPQDEVYLPQNREELDQVTHSLDVFGERMTGKRCLMGGCEEPVVWSHRISTGQCIAFCAKHGDSSLGEGITES